MDQTRALRVRSISLVSEAKSFARVPVACVRARMNFFGTSQRSKAGADAPLANARDLPQSGGG